MRKKTFRLLPWYKNTIICSTAIRIFCMLVHAWHLVFITYYVHSLNTYRKIRCRRNYGCWWRHTAFSVHTYVVLHTCTVLCIWKMFLKCTRRTNTPDHRPEYTVQVTFRICIFVYIYMIFLLYRHLHSTSCRDVVII